MQITIIKESWKRFWDAEEIRILVLASLCLQFGLVFFAPWRKRTARKPLIILLWSFYQAADYIAILALGNILKEQNQKRFDDLTAFWAPFLLLHLGGPDTITSYSIEDNELWLRHLIGLVVQTTIAFVVVLGLLAIPRLRIAVAFVFITGLVKYAERTWALRSASMNVLRGSLVKDPNPGPNYAEFMQEYVWRREAGQSGYVKKKNEATQLQQPSDHKYSDDVQLLVEAYDSFKRFMPIVVDLMLTFEDRKISQTYFWKSTASNAFKVVEMELSFLYDVFHTKAIHIRCINGGIWRFISLGLISAAFIIFHNCEKQGYVNSEISISYILLGSAVFMELTSLVLITTSDWMIVTLTRHTWLILNKLAGVITLAVSFIFSKGKPRWSNSMSQYNLLSLSLGDKEEYLLRRIFGAGKVEELSSVKVEESTSEKTVKESSLKKMVKVLYLDKLVKVLYLDKMVKLSLEKMVKILLFLEKMVKLSFEKMVKVLFLDKLVKVLYLDKVVKLSLKNMAKVLLFLKKMVKVLLFLAKMVKLSLEKMVNVLLSLEKTVKELWNNFIFVHTVGVPCELKALLFEELKKKSESAHHTADFKELRYCKGEKTLKEEGCSHLAWTVEKEFDESILLWHIATDLCFYIHSNANENSETGQGIVERIKRLVNFCATNNNISYSNREISLIMSNYLVYLLIMQPSMMPAGIGKIRFQDTCTEAKLFFRAEKKGLTEAEAREALLDVETEVDPIQVKGDRCKSVLFDACRLAKELNLLPVDERWRLISKVWVEMLGYAAVSCKTNYHIKQLSQGGELLTHVWLLMAHMGIGEQYRVETGHAAAKLAFNN
ncbi:hypothetical protein FCM35_KLT16321 [Carex littledalei]|uniref:DUF4220 domain-containing protein n=1 Tax=Carex littledalei TaxID=544730 RepID=A0A833VRL3_9POAL|nr:hypothetical protein FCM35_KLT16321 [Carex littledalei]